MNIEFHEEPWLHGIVDDFISEDHLNLFHKSWNQKDDKLPPDVHTALGKEIRKRFTFVLDNFYNELNVGGIGDERPYSKDRPKSLFVVHEPFHQHYRHIHLDSNDKILSGVLYLSNKGTGTSLYYPNGKRHSQVEWKPNRAIFFTRKQKGINATYHAVENDIPHHRATFLMNFHRDEEKIKRGVKNGETWLNDVPGSRTNLPISKPLKFPK
tara:strand:- start:591 stop:1223 length:633 start_codon:yes stop_codon:yes gene_type:complete